MFSTHRTGWSTSRAESAEPKAVTSNRRREWQVQKLRSSVLSTDRTGWSMSTEETAKPKAAADNRRSELQVRKL